MHMTSHNTTDNHLTIHTTSALSTFPSLISIHYRIVRCLPPSIIHWRSLLSCTSFSTCSSCTSVHIFLLLLIHLHLTWSIHFVLHLLNGNLLAIFIFGTIKGILLQSIWHPYHILLSTCPSISHPVIHVPIHITSCYSRVHPYHILLYMCPSISHPVIHVPTHITSCYPRAHPYRILLYTCPFISHPVIHVPIQIASCYPRAHPDRIPLSMCPPRSHPRPDHILPICLRFWLSISNISGCHSGTNFTFSWDLMTCSMEDSCITRNTLHAFLWHSFLFMKQ